jgi:hypothetical protein
MLGCLLEAAFHVLLEFVLVVLLLPAMMLAATPFIPIVALFGPGDYPSKVRRCYSQVFEAWLAIAGHF